MGHPAACMIENNPVLSAARGFLGRAIMAREGLATSGAQTPSDIETTATAQQSTGYVDNFVGNSHACGASPRNYGLRRRLLKS